MPKTIRFSELVKRSGRPATVALWTKPQDNPAFQKAVKQNRILTIDQTGGHSDFGEIGFHQMPHATYLEFPKPLPKACDIRVVGINYDLLDEPPSKVSFKATKPPPPPRPAKMEPPKTKQFEVTILRTATMERKFSVVAPDSKTAKELALEIEKGESFKPDNLREEIKSVEQT